MATGVLILGIGSGTKCLSRFLECTKSYETVILFGAATDSYDAVGKIVKRAPYEHVTKKAVEEALANFRGNIMQRPPVFSALKVQGKPLYQYAREGKEIPIEIEERPVEVKSLEMMEWMDGGTHGYYWPEEEASEEERAVTKKVIPHLEDSSGSSRKREGSGVDGGEDQTSKRDKSSPGPEPAPTTVTTKRQVDDLHADNEQEVPVETAPPLKRSKLSPTKPLEREPMQADEQVASTVVSALHKPPCPAPACRIRMTVTSGFYVRSLAHDLGAAVGSLALMSSLVRTRQGGYELGENVFEYVDLAKGEADWAPKIGGMLHQWGRDEGIDREVGEIETSKGVVSEPKDASPKQPGESRAGKEKKERREHERGAVE
jgi:tRNA pseudouridine55 synthase